MADTNVEIHVSGNVQNLKEKTNERDNNNIIIIIIIITYAYLVLCIGNSRARNATGYNVFYDDNKNNIVII